MCGIAGYLGTNKDVGLAFGNNACSELRHRGPDDNGVYNDEQVTLAHTRLSILELSKLGHQPMLSSCGRYVIVFNGEIYNHLDLRKQYLSNHRFNGHSDTETLIELFRIRKEKMLGEMVGMWALAIWDKEAKQLFVSRDRYGQKPLYIRKRNGAWQLASEIQPLLSKDDQPSYDTTALVEYLALGNYGHLGIHTFYKDIKQFPEGAYAWLSESDEHLKTEQYWELPNIPDKDKVPFDERVQKGLHNCIVEAVLSQTLSDVPIGITLSGGIDSSIITGILATYYDKEMHIFTAQSPHSQYDETKYVDSVIKKFASSHFVVHRKNLDDLSIKNNLSKYIKIQEEPFGDPSIIAHGYLMSMAATAGIKVILNGQGADELFFGYNNMAQAILSKQFKSMRLNDFSGNLSAMKLGKGFLMRILLESFLPGLEYNLRKRSRIQRRDILQPQLLNNVDNNITSLHKYNNTYNVWRESIYGVHIPHLVHYDDRNAMAFSIEGRMPFLDHRIAEYVATIQPEYFLKNGMRKYILRESCKQYLPEIIYNRTDKIGFYTPLINSLNKDENWISSLLQENGLLKNEQINLLLDKFKNKTLKINDALQVWRCISVISWMNQYNIKA